MEIVTRPSPFSIHRSSSKLDFYKQRAWFLPFITLIMDLDGSMNGYIVDNEAVIVSCFAEEHLPPRVSHSTIRIITELWFFFFFFFRMQIMKFA